LKRLIMASSLKEIEKMFYTSRSSKPFFGILLAMTAACSSTTNQQKIIPLKPTAVDVKAAAYPSPSPQMSSDGKLKLFIPENVWVRIYFEEIDARVKKSGLTNLRETVLPEGDLEVRVWEGFSFFPIRGVVIKRRAGQWEAHHIRQMREGDTEAPITSYPEPPLGWDNFWGQLVEDGILSLPDSYSIGCVAGMTDSICYVVEINSDHVYRTYMYADSDASKCAEAKKMLQIAQAIW
jgi:hypothetical protein